MALSDRSEWHPWPQDAGAWANFLLMLAAGALYAGRMGAAWGPLVLGLGLHLALFLGSSWGARYLRALFFGRPLERGQGLLSLGATCVALGLSLFFIRVLQMDQLRLEAYLSLGVAALIGLGMLLWARHGLGSRHPLILIGTSLMLGLPGLWMAAEAPHGLDAQAVRFWAPLALFFPGSLAVLEAWMQRAWIGRVQRAMALLPHVLLALHGLSLAPGWLKGLALAVPAISAGILFMAPSGSPDGRSVHWMGWQQFIFSVLFCAAWAWGPWNLI